LRVYGSAAVRRRAPGAGKSAGQDEYVGAGGVTKEKPGCWTRRRAFAQVRQGSNIQLLSYSLVTGAVLTTDFPYDAMAELGKTWKWSATTNVQGDDVDDCPDEGRTH
jgi:hypothetical protein